MSNIVEQYRQNALRWFSGKALANASHALDLLAESEAEGCWVPNAKRTVDSCLYKTNIAKKIYRTHGASIESLGTYDDPVQERGYRVAFILQFGAWRRPGDINWQVVRSKTNDPDLLKILDLSLEYTESFDALSRLAYKLDTVAPKPQITSVGVSPTVTKTLAEINVEGRLSTIRLCPIEWRKVDTVDKNKRPIQIWVGRLKWPAGTVHGASRFTDNDGSLSHCQACGHSIQNAFNWVPILMDTAQGIPVSLWVGRDCSRNLFGIRIKNDFILEHST